MVTSIADLNLSGKPNCRLDNESTSTLTQARHLAFGLSIHLCDALQFIMLWKHHLLKLPGRKDWRYQQGCWY